MRHFLIIIAIFFSTTFLFAQTSNEIQFNQTVKDVVLKLSRRDSAGLSHYIDKKIGVYILYRNGTKDPYKFMRTIGFSDTTFPNYPFYDKAKLTTLKYASLPTFDCDKEKWTKTGTYVDTTKTDHLLSKTAKWLNKNYEENISSRTILSFTILENIGRRVVVADNIGNELIFYLSYIDNNWRLTIIDKVTCDCSA